MVEEVEVHPLLELTVLVEMLVTLVVLVQVP